MHETQKQKKVSLKKRNNDDQCVSYLKDVKQPTRKQKNEMEKREKIKKLSRRTS